MEIKQPTLPRVVGIGCYLCKETFPRKDLFLVPMIKKKKPLCSSCKELVNKKIKHWMWKLDASEDIYTTCHKAKKYNAEFSEVPEEITCPDCVLSYEGGVITTFDAMVKELSPYCRAKKISLREWLLKMVDQYTIVKD